MTLSKLLGKKGELPIPELEGKMVLYQIIERNEITSEGEKKITEACLDFFTDNLIIKVWGEAVHIRNYKEFLEGAQAKFWALNMYGYRFRLKEPLLDFEYIEKEIKRQRLIRKILERWYDVRCFFKPILPALIFILKCITFALILKLIL